MKANPNHDELGRFSSGPGGATHATSDTDPSHDIRSAERFSRLKNAAHILSERLSQYPRKPGEEKFAWQGRLLAGLDQHTKQDLFDMIRERYQPVDFAAKGATEYRKDNGLPEPQVDWRYVRADTNKGKAVAEAFTRVTNQSHDPRVIAAYSDFKRQNEAQYDFMTRKLGIKVSYVTGEAYPSAEAQADDVRDHHHLNVEHDLGHGHPLMSSTDYDHFRAVHDFFGHAAVGGGFDRHGEYAAWLMHNSMYTGEGRKAMSSEYHGSNSALWNGKDSHPHALLLPDNLIQNPFDANGYWVRKSAAIDNDSFSSLDGDSRHALYEMARLLQLTPDEVNRHDNQCASSCTNHAAFSCASTVTKADTVAFFTKDWEEDKHPRVPAGGKGGGQFTAGGAPGPAAGGSVPKDLTHTSIPGITMGFHQGMDTSPHYPHVVVDEMGTVMGHDYSHPIQAQTVDEAAMLLSEGQYVQLKQTREVATLLDKLNDIAKEAEAKGEKAPEYNLCQVSVPGTNLFCAENKGYARVEMPQLSGKPTPGSRADLLPKNDKGEVNLAPFFIQHLKDQGIQIREENEDPAYLRASQNELQGSKVAGIMGAMRAGKMADAAIFVSSDNYVIDGHHRWAAKVGVGAHGEKVTQPIHRVDMPIIDALKESNKFAEEWGIPQASMTGKVKVKKSRRGAPPCVGCDKPSRIGRFFRKFNENHDDKGRFASSGGAGGAKVITASDISPSGQGRSRAVTREQFAHLMEQGEARLQQLATNQSPPAALLDPTLLGSITNHAYTLVKESWGGGTFDAHTGRHLNGDSTSWAITAHQGTSTVAIPDTSSRTQFGRAVNEAVARFSNVLSHDSYALGFFHDDDLHRIDIDPVVVVHSQREVDEVGAATHAVGGAYHFASGNGFWPPHVEERANVLVKMFPHPKTHAQHTHDVRDPDAEMFDCGEDGDDANQTPDASHLHLHFYTKAGLWDESKHPRGQPGNAGQFGPGGAGGSVPKFSDPARPTSAFNEPLLAPDDQRPEPLGPSGKGVARPSNPHATELSSLPPEHQQALLDQVDAIFPGTTPETLRDNVSSLLKEAQDSDPEAMEYGTHWYEDAHDVIADFGTSTGHTPRQAIGIAASLSPNAEWGQNMAMAKFVMSTHKENPVVTLGKGDHAYLDAKAKGKSSAGTDIPSGTHYNDLTPEQAAWATIVLGRRSGLRGEIPTPKGTYPLLGWATGTGNLAKAINIARGTQDPDEALNGHKVRSFFNNIADPTDSQGRHDVTMDSHAISASLKVRMSNEMPELKKLISNPASRANNTKGAYSVFADAYRHAAEKSGLTPNQVQAIVWSHWQHVRFGYADPQGGFVSARLQARYGSAQNGGGRNKPGDE